MSPCRAYEVYLAQVAQQFKYSEKSAYPPGTAPPDCCWAGARGSKMSAGKGVTSAVGFARVINGSRPGADMRPATDVWWIGGQAGGGGLVAGCRSSMGGLGAAVW